MSAGATIVWCFAIVCATILLAQIISVVSTKKTERYDTLMKAYKDIQRELEEKTPSTPLQTRD